MGPPPDYQRHPVIPPRPVGLGLVVLAGWTLLLSIMGQSYVLFSSSVVASDSLYINSWDVIGMLVAVLSVVGASWLVTLALPRPIRLGVEMRSPMLDPFVEEKRVARIELRDDRDVNVRAAQATYIPYIIAGNICVGEFSSWPPTTRGLTYRHPSVSPSRCQVPPLDRGTPCGFPTCPPRQPHHPKLRHLHRSAQLETP